MSRTNARHGKDGYKLASDLYRTINGAPYIAWMSFPSVDRIAAYRARGIRCRRFGDELFIAESDQDAARVVDSQH